MLDRQNDFRQIELGSFLLKVHLIVQHPSQVAAREVLEHEDVAGSFVEGKWSLYQVVSSYFFEDLVLVFYRRQLLLPLRF